MTPASPNKVLGEPVDRIDGRLKVTGAARYPSDVGYPDMAYAALVDATIAAGTIRRIDTAAALAAPGVLTVLTHEKAPPLTDGPTSLLGPICAHAFSRKRERLRRSLTRTSFRSTQSKSATRCCAS